jgi:hypothetical protein
MKRGSGPPMYTMYTKPSDVSVKDVSGPPKYPTLSGRFFRDVSLTVFYIILSIAAIVVSSYAIDYYKDEWKTLVIVFGVIFMPTFIFWFVYNIIQLIVYYMDWISYKEKIYEYHAKMKEYNTEKQEKAEKERVEREIAQKAKDTKKVPAQDIEEQKRLQKIAEREKERDERETAAIKKTKDNVDHAIKTITDDQSLETALIKEYYNASYFVDVGVAFNKYIRDNQHIPDQIKKKLVDIAEKDSTDRMH